MILPISKLPAQVLRAKVQDIHFPLEKKLKRLLLDMLETVVAADGIGLAAPQIGQNINMALIYLTHEGKEPFFIFNPKIIEISKETLEIEEGCLSLPKVYGMVRRPKKITVEFQDIQGKKQAITDNEWTSRVLQHEIDHLNGTLILDKFEKITQGKELLKQFNP